MRFLTSLEGDPGPRRQPMRSEHHDGAFELEAWAWERSGETLYHSSSTSIRHRDFEM